MEANSEKVDDNDANSFFVRFCGSPDDFWRVIDVFSGGIREAWQSFLRAIKDPDVGPISFDLPVPGNKPQLGRYICPPTALDVTTDPVDLFVVAVRDTTSEEIYPPIILKNDSGDSLGSMVPYLVDSCGTTHLQVYFDDIKWPGYSRWWQPLYISLKQQGAIKYEDYSTYQEIYDFEAGTWRMAKSGEMPRVAFDGIIESSHDELIGPEGKEYGVIPSWLNVYWHHRQLLVYPEFLFGIDEDRYEILLMIGDEVGLILRVIDDMTAHNVHLYVEIVGNSDNSSRSHARYKMAHDIGLELADYLRVRYPSSIETIKGGNKRFLKQRIYPRSCAEFEGLLNNFLLEYFGVDANREQEFRSTRIVHELDQLYIVDSQNEHLIALRTIPLWSDTSVSVQMWPMTHHSPSHSATVQAAFDALVSYLDEQNDAEKVAELAGRWQSGERVPAELLPTRRNTIHLVREPPREPGSDENRDKWCQYKYECDRSGTIKFTHKMLGEKISMSEGAAKNYYNQVWKPLHIMPDVKM
jgi:hypothetical protein